MHETLATIARLPERQRDALLQIAVQGRSQDEVADELGVSRTAARALVHRARTALRAAASAAVPFPVLVWLASAGAGTEPMSLRIGQLIAGAGGAGATTMLLKAGAVAGVAAAVSAPMIADRHAPKPRPAAAHAAPTRIVETAAAPPVPTAGAQRPAAVPVRFAPLGGGAQAPARRASGGHRRTGRTDDGERQGTSRPRHDDDPQLQP